MLKHIDLNAHFSTCPPKIEHLLLPATHDQVSAYACERNTRSAYMDGSLRCCSIPRSELLVKPSTRRELTSVASGIRGARLGFSFHLGDNELFLWFKKRLKG